MTSLLLQNVSQTLIWGGITIGSLTFSYGALKCPPMSQNLGGAVIEKSLYTAFSVPCLIIGTYSGYRTGMYAYKSAKLMKNLIRNK